MLRAVRFAAKLGFRIHAESEAPIFELGHLLDDISPSRLFDETLKLFLSGNAVATFELLRHYRLFERLFPATEEALSMEENHFPLTLVSRALENTDQRIAVGKPVTPAFLYAALLWEPTRRLAQQMEQAEAGLTWLQALHAASSLTVSRQAKCTSIPKRFSVPMREIWAMQSRLEQRSGKRPLRLLEHPRFRASYDFLLLRAESGEAPVELAQWWTRFQDTDSDQQHAMLQEAPVTKTSKRRRRPRKRRPNGAGA